jgi:hypothetical protein
MEQGRNEGTYAQPSPRPAIKNRPVRLMALVRKSRMKKGIKRLILLNCAGTILAAGWAYSSHMQNMINVGVLREDYDYWLRFAPFVSVPSIIIWLTLVVGTPICASRSRLDLKKSILLMTINLGTMHLVLFSLALWLDHAA